MLHPYDPTLVSNTEYAALVDAARREAQLLQRKAPGDCVAWLALAVASRWRRWRARQDTKSGRAGNNRLARAAACHG